MWYIYIYIYIFQNTNKRTHSTYSSRFNIWDVFLFVRHIAFILHLYNMYWLICMELYGYRISSTAQPLFWSIKGVAPEASSASIWGLCFIFNLAIIPHVWGQLAPPHHHQQKNPTKTQQFWQTWQTKWKMERWKNIFWKNKSWQKKTISLTVQNKTPHIHSSASSDEKSCEKTHLCGTQVPFRLQPGCNFKKASIPELSPAYAVLSNSRTLPQKLRPSDSSQHLPTRRSRRANVWRADSCDVARCYQQKTTTGAFSCNIMSRELVAIFQQTTGPFSSHFAPVDLCEEVLVAEEGKELHLTMEKVPCNSVWSNICGGWRICSSNWTITSLR